MRLNDNNLTREQLIEDAGTTTVVNPLTVTHNSTGTPAANFGVGLAALAETNTTPDTPAGSLAWRWVVATHASRQVEVLLNGFVGSSEGALLRARTPSASFGSSPNAIGNGAVDLMGRKAAATNVPAAAYSFLSPGSANTIGSAATYSSIIGGLGNTVTGASGQFSAIVAGSGNSITNTLGVIAGGIGNSISASFGFIGAGAYNTVSFGYGVAFGFRAVADLHAALAFSGGRFSANGDAQTVLLNVRRQVTHTGANWYELYLDGGSGPARIDIPTDTLFTFDVLIAGATAGLVKSFGFAINGVIENDGGVTTLLASNVTTLYDTDDVSYDARVTADDGNDALLIEVSDADSSGDVVKWVATVRLASVTAA